MIARARNFVIARYSLIARESSLSRERISGASYSCRAAGVITGSRGDGVKLKIADDAAAGVVVAVVGVQVCEWRGVMKKLRDVESRF